MGAAPGGGRAAPHDPKDDAFQLYELMKDALRQCKRRTAPGADSVSCEIIRERPASGTKTLQKFYNLVWDEGQLPDDWKNAVVLPILKRDKSVFEPFVISSNCNVM